MLISLEREANERGEPVATGLLKMIKTYKEVISTLYGEAKLEQLGLHYGSGICPVISLKSEWSVFAIYMVQNCKEFSMQGVLQLLSTNSTLQSLYPNLSNLVSFCQILPMSTVDCERAFSTLKQIKT